MGPWTVHLVPGSPAALGGVAAGDFGFVAVGWNLGETQRRGGIWYSSDGAHWEKGTGQRIYRDGRVPSGVLAHQSDVIVWGEDTKQGGTVVWFSEGGKYWDLVATGEAPLDGEYATGGLALDSGGFLLYGGEPRVFLSTDGRTWERLETPVDFAAIVQTGSALIANGGEQGQRTTWISNDGGRTWTLLAENQPNVQTMIDTPRGIIAAGFSADGNPKMWISEDGTDFIETGPLFYREGNHYALLFFDGRVVAVGHDGSPRHNLMMWVSEDGHEWQEVDLSGPLLSGRPMVALGTLLDMARRDSVLVAVGAFEGNAGLVLRYDADSSDSLTP